MSCFWVLAYLTTLFHCRGALLIYMAILRFTYYVYDCRDKVVDFHWNAHDPWTIVSVSNDDESTGGGGTLQVSVLLFASF